MENSQKLMKFFLVATIVGHWAIIIGNLTAFFVLPFATKWYVALPIMSYIGLLTFSRVLDCPITKLENKIRVKLGMPTIKGFVSHYLVKPYKRRKVAKRKMLKNTLATEVQIPTITQLVNLKSEELIENNIVDQPEIL